MPTVVTPKISRIEVDFAEFDKVRITLNGYRLIEEDGESPITAHVSPVHALVSTSLPEVSDWLVFILAQAKTKFGRDDIVFDFPPEAP